MWLTILTAAACALLAAGFTAAIIIDHRNRQRKIARWRHPSAGIITPDGKCRECGAMVEDRYLHIMAQHPRG